METRKILTILVVALVMIVFQTGVDEAAPMGTAFTYQGRLIDGNDVADGLYDFQFKLFDSAADGNQVNEDVNVPDLDVIEGYFTVELDFNDLNAFNGDARWLQLGVRPGDMNDPNVYMFLSPRQEVTPAPYALYAANSGADSDWIISGNDMYSGVPGNVGIGTTSPGDKLAVHGGDIKIGSADKGVVFYGGGEKIIGTSGYGIDLQTSNGTSRMTILNNGNVGIGTTSPTGLFDVRGGSTYLDKYFYLRDFDDGTLHTSMIARDKNWMFWDGGVVVGHYSDGAIGEIGTANMVVKGNVGIGTTGPGDKLDVDGHINSSESYKLDGDTVLSNTGTENIFVGKDAGVSNTTGQRNAVIGYKAFYSNTEGAYNSAMGSYALQSNTTGGWNSAMGTWALQSNTTGNDNSAMGYGALRYNTTGNDNSAMGYLALNSNTTGYNNSAMGYYALRYNNTGYDNSAMGYGALRNNTTGKYNSAMGSQALWSNTTGWYNTATGFSALQFNTEGWYNTAVGVTTLYNKTTGNYNTALGYGAGSGNSTGSGNVFIGYSAGSSETGSNKLYIDNSSTTTPLIYGDFSANRLGINRVPTANAFEVEGNASKSTAGSWLANSDARIKTDVQTITGALDTLDKVRLVSFKYTDDYGDAHPSVEDRRYFNVIAQEFRNVFPDYVKGSGEKLPHGDEILQVDSYPLTVYSAAAVQELHDIVKAKDAEIMELKERVSKMEAFLANLLDEQKGAQR